MISNKEQKLPFLLNDPRESQKNLEFVQRVGQWSLSGQHQRQLKDLPLILLRFQPEVYLFGLDENIQNKELPPLHNEPKHDGQHQSSTTIPSYCRREERLIESKIHRNHAPTR